MIAWLILALGCGGPGEPSQAQLDVQAHYAQSSSGQAVQGMVYVPSGPFLQGEQHTDPHRSSEEEEVVEVATFYIDLHAFPNDPAKVPKRWVTLNDARESCARQGKRLCTALEWEKACKGPGSAVWSYGPTYEPGRCPETLGEKRPLGEDPSCSGGFGVRGMLGLPREWTSTTVDVDPTSAESRITRSLSQVPVEEVHYLLGGPQVDPIHGAAPAASRCASLSHHSRFYRDGSVGFRCCKDVVPQGSD